jgi:photosystem II stability/assembly factor-like uncharacterized protein
MANGLPDGGGPSGMVIDPRNSNVYVGLREGGIYASTDGGASWHHQEFPWSVRINDLAIDPFSSDKVLAVIDEGRDLAATSNGGASWDYLVGSPGRQRAVAIDPQNPSNIWVGDDFKFGGYCIFNPIDFTETCSCNLTLYVYSSENGGQSWTSSSHGLISGEMSWSDIVYGHCSSRVSDIMIKPDDSETILIAMMNFNGALKRTTDGGDNWVYVGGPSRTIAANPGDSSYMYYGHEQWSGYTQVGSVYASSNGGATWGYLSLNESWPGSITSVIDLEVNREFFGEYGYAPTYAATSSGLIKTAWNGSDWSWEKVSGLPTDNITALAIDHSTVPGVIYVGTGDAGVFVSLDGGSIWTPFNENLGDLSIKKLAISASQPKTLYAGTNYAGVWSLVIVIDTDSDGLPDDLENTTCTNIDNQDTDNDGILDGLEDANHNGIVESTETDPCDVDSDKDGVQDGMELGYTLGDISPDTDTEIFQPDLDPTTTTDPLLADTDGDGIPDGIEDINLNGKVDTEETDPNIHDTDGDGLNDGIELAYWGSNWNADPDGDQLVNLLDPDSDNDGLSDGVEVNILGTNPLSADTDGNGTPDNEEDNDGDGLTNAEEVQCSSDPLDSNSKCAKGLPFLMLLLD